MTHHTLGPEMHTKHFYTRNLNRILTKEHVIIIIEATAAVSYYLELTGDDEGFRDAPGPVLAEDLLQLT